MGRPLSTYGSVSEAGEFGPRVRQKIRFVFPYLQSFLMAYHLPKLAGTPFIFAQFQPSHTKTAWKTEFIE